MLDPLVDFVSARTAHMKKDRSHRDKRVSLKEAVAEFVKDGDVLSDTGFELVKPDRDIPVTPAPPAEVLDILRKEVDPFGVFTSMPGVK